MSGVPEHGANGGDDALERLLLIGEATPAGGGERVVACAPVVLGRSPLRLDAAVEQQALERRVERAFANLQDIPGELLDALCDAVAMHRATYERAQHEEVE